MYYLRNINNKFDEISRKEYVDNVIDDDGEMISWQTRELILSNDIHKQSIVLREHRTNDEEFLDDTIKVGNCLSNEAYDYLSYILRNYDNVTIMLYQVYQTASDYTIIFDNYITNSDKLNEYIAKNHIDREDICGYKYIEYVNDHEQRCDFKKILN
jgi:hypothetical protein